MPALEVVAEGLKDWSQRRGLTLHCYTDEEVRRAVVGRDRVSNSQLAYAIMELLGTVGEGRTTREWEAIAAGYYHLAQRE
jgi:Holliday junction resolvasome RuvABC endonuclease subunit